MKRLQFILILWSVMAFNPGWAQQKHEESVQPQLKNGQGTDDVLEALPEQEFITGDFNGDRQPDSLTVSFVSRIDNSPILINTDLDYDQLIQKTVAKKPILELTSDNLQTLHLNKDNFYILGLDLLQNIGNINTFPGDEIAVILKAADWSGINVCSIYTYSRSGWIKIKETEIREEEIPDIRTGKFKPWKR